jgi:hypothetical protein
MHSIDGLKVDVLLDEFDAAHSRFLASRLDLLTVPELLAVMEHYEFLMGRLDALKYELTSPFARRAGAGIVVGS